VEAEPELDAVRRSIRSGRLFGTAHWTERVDERLGIELPPPSPGPSSPAKTNFYESANVKPCRFFLSPL
jgi:hypothetical protein